MAAPTISSLSPTFGTLEGGTIVTIIGTNFNVAPVKVFFSGVESPSVVVSSPTSLTAVTPALGQKAPTFVTVQNADGASTPNALFQFYFLDGLPSANISANNPYFDPAANYTVFGQWNFEVAPIFPGGGSGPVTGAANVGAGSGVFASLAGSTLNFKSLTAGAGITLTPSGTEIQISAGGGSGWLTDGSNTGPGPLSLGTSDATGWDFVSMGVSNASVAANGAWAITKSLTVGGVFTVTTVTSSVLTSSTWDIVGTGPNTGVYNANIRLTSVMGNVLLESQAAAITVVGTTAVLAGSSSANIDGPIINIFNVTGINNPGIVVDDTANQLIIQADAAGGTVEISATGTGGSVSLPTADLLSPGMVAATGTGGAAPTTTPPAGYDYAVIDAAGHIRRYKPT